MNYSSLRHIFSVEENTYRAFFDVEYRVSEEGIDLLDFDLSTITRKGKPVEISPQLRIDANNSFAYAFGAGSYRRKLLAAARKWGYEEEVQIPSYLSDVLQELPDEDY